jgi:anti-sigma regulatory factor (Ser/Thr protein kinase)
MSSVSAVLRNDRSEILRMAALAEQFGAEAQLPEEDVMTVNLVLDEIVANVIENAYEDSAEHEIHVSLTRDGDTLTVRVEDDGRAFDPLQAPPPDLDLPIEERPIGGLGIHIVRSVMDAVDYQRRGDRNILTMRKTIGRS